LIIGGGQTAAEAATALRKEGYDGHLVVVADEARVPYERPALSKDYLRGETPFEKLAAGDAEVWNSAGTELITNTRAVHLDPRSRQVDLDNGRSVRFDRLLLATGSSAIRDGIPGAD